MPATMPTWLEPMAATLTRARFEGPEWVFERKLDGIRVIAYRDGPEVRLLSRNQLPQGHHYPSFATAVAALPVDGVILDGEALDGRWDPTVPPGYYLFDVLWLDGVDLTSRTLDERRAILAGLPLEPPLILTARLEGPEPWKRACAEGWEGVIAKRRDSVYEHRRSRSWLKMKCEAGQELVVGGFTEPRGARVGLGALLVGYFDGDDFVFAGKIGTGLDNALLSALRTRLDALAVASPPFTKGTGLPRAARWARPEIVVQVAFMEWTSGGKLRHPRLVRLREDKPARTVTRESR